MMRRRPRALLDANVLWSPQLRNLLLQLANQETIEVYWSSLIEDESLRNVDERQRERIVARTIPLIRKHFPDALVRGFDPSSSIGSRKDSDRHVAAAAIASSPCVLVTWNVSDFGREELVQKAVVPKTPDEFLCSLCDENPDLVYASTRQAQANLTKSAPTWSAYLEILSERNRLREFVRRLKQFEDENK